VSPTANASRLTIGLVRRGHSETGGAEAYLKRLAHGLNQAGHATRLFTDSSWPAREWSWGPITRISGETARGFANELVKAEPKRDCDLLLSLERVWQCDVYRAGDGIHQVWMRKRDAASSAARRWFRRVSGKDRDTIELERALFTGGARHVIANSEMVKWQAQEFYSYPPDQIDVVANGVPLTDFRPDPEARRIRREVLRLREDEVAVLFVGSGWERKGLHFAVRAVTSLGKNMRLLVAGRGRRDFANQPNVQLLGAVRDLPGLYAAADIFLLPTLYDPFSNACLEALASGLPVITTRDNGFSEIIENGVHGSIINDASEIDAIRQALLFWSDPERRRAARTAIVERASRFDITRNVEGVLDVLNHLPKADAVSGKIRKT
jgi:UDP-glucose:(heptosyl)LPS alpha-1,3-glucosyltransferase